MNYTVKVLDQSIRLDIIGGLTAYAPLESTSQEMYLIVQQAISDNTPIPVYLLTGLGEDPSLRDLSLYKLQESVELNHEGDLNKVTYYRKYNSQTGRFSEPVAERRLLYVRHLVNGLITPVCRLQILTYFKSDGDHLHIPSIKYYNTPSKVIEEGRIRRKYIIDNLKGKLLMLLSGQGKASEGMSLLSVLKPLIELYIEGETEPLKQAVLQSELIAGPLKQLINSELTYSLSVFTDESYSDEKFLKGEYTF